jgi:hypothetical protein
MSLGSRRAPAEDGNEATAGSLAYPVSVPVDKHTLQAFALALAPPTATVANYCDHVEHNEEAHPAQIIAAAGLIRHGALNFAQALGADLFELYASRLGMIEDRNVLKRPGAFDGRAASLAAVTWSDLQNIQFEHDRFYHADVVGLAKIEQLRHYALHLAKIVGAFAVPADTTELLSRRLPDTLLFAIKLQTVMGDRLPDDPLPRPATQAPESSEEPVAAPVR